MTRVKINTFWRLQYYLLMLNKRAWLFKGKSHKYNSSKDLPVVFSCSGCSSTGQMANYIAIQLDRKRVADMSCVAGVGGSIKPVLRTVFSARKTVTIDGCPLACSKACLQKLFIEPDASFELTGMGVIQKEHGDFNLGQARLVLRKIEREITGSANDVAFYYS